MVEEVLTAVFAGALLRGDARPQSHILGYCGAKEPEFRCKKGTTR